MLKRFSLDVLLCGITNMPLPHFILAKPNQLRFKREFFGLLISFDLPVILFSHCLILFNLTSILSAQVLQAIVKFLTCKYNVELIGPK